MKRLLVILVLIAGAALVYWSGSGSDKSGQFSMPPPVVGAGQIHQQAITETLESLGTLRAWEAVEITTKVTGKIKRINFADNSLIQHNDVIVELDAASEQARLRETTANLDEDQRLLRHYMALDKTRAVSKTRLNEQRSKVAASKARVAAAQAELDNFIIRAPFNGRLGVRQISPGALVTPGTIITTLDDIDKLKLDFTVPETWVGKIQVNQVVIVHSIAFPNETFSAEITSIGTRLDPVTRAISLHGQLQNSQQLLKPGMLLTIDLVSTEREAMMISEQALLLEGSGKFVYLIDEANIIRRIEVKSGVRIDGKVEIISGLEVGQKIVTEGTQKVRDGMAVMLSSQGVGR